MSECANSDSRDQRAALDEITDTLADAQRRYVISFLDGREGPVTVGDLTRNICNEGIVSSDGKSLDAEHVYVTLYHCHLPKLASANCITFDRKKETVSKDVRFHEFSEPLRKLRS